MGRLGSDVLALSCIAGGAVIATGITAALLASPAAHAPRADASCSSEVVVRVGSAHDESGDLKIFSTADVCSAIRVDVAELGERMEEVRLRAEEARARGEVVRVEAARVRRDVRTAEIKHQEARLGSMQNEWARLGERIQQVREVETETPKVEEALAEAREQLERQIEELTATLERRGND